MGAQLARDLAETDITLEQQITYHLRANHYPPVPYEMVQVCLDAIDAVNYGDPYQEIELPDGTYYRGNTAAPANAIVQGHHLDPWVDYG